MEPGTSTSPIKRRLTAILAADAVGYSRHMGADEEGTLRMLAAQRAIIDRIIVSHGGRIISTAGDSVLAEFASSVEAVRCAVEIQEALETRNVGLPESERLAFRIGVNLGDVMVDGADILGDGVNVAARLEGIAEPGGVCISSSVYDQIAGKLNLGFVDIGEKSLKNIARPIRVYRFDRSGSAAGATRAPSKSRNRWLAAVGAVAVVVAGVGAWRAGIFDRAAPPPAASAPATVAASAPPPTAQARPPEPASEEMKVKLQIAEAERAKAEAELARSRADAEAAKERTAAAAAERKKIPQVPAAPAPSTPPPPTTAASPPAVAMTAPAATAPPRAATSGTATRSCDAWEEVRPLTDTVPVRVVDGEIVVERGDPGKPGYIRATGRPTADGHLVLAGSFFTLLPRLKFKEFPVRFEGAFRDGQYTLNGTMGTRACKVIIRLDNRP